MSVYDLAAALLAGKNADPFQFLQVLGRGFAFGDASLYDKCDLAVGLLEDQLDQLFRVDPRRFLLAAFPSSIQRRAIAFSPSMAVSVISLSLNSVTVFARPYGGS